MFERAALVHFHEIGLKGRNRSTFENRLASNLRFALRGVDGVSVERIASRALVRVPDPSMAGQVLAACAAVPGVVHVQDCLVTGRDLDEMTRAASIVMRAELDRRGRAAVRGFAVDARRSATEFAVGSMEMNRTIGAALLGEFGVPVRLDDPDLTVRVEVVQGAAYVSARREEGPGGLPVGSSGRVVCLLSAGIDSPVAAWRIARRGAVVIGVHFSGAPQTGDQSTRDVYDIAAALAPSGGIARVYSVAFGDIQRTVMLSCPPDLRVLLYRRLMLRVAEAIAAAESARALVTGESLGQVASQTLENIAAVDAAAAMPILRPLVGSDKIEIIREAKRLGTYAISVRPHPDCCTLFMPRTPETRAKAETLAAAEEALDIPALVAEALGSVRHRDFPCPAYRAPRHVPGTADPA